ncbi:MAG: hypothetical protein IT317_18920 [Anaerolineales bacterium]|nr:hypothetical protein [Anaerolineales bacterium]
MKPLLAGVDLGTSSLKAGLYSPNGERLALQRVPYPLHAPQPGWAEQDPADWWAAAVQALRVVAAAAEGAGGAIAALGLAGQCPGHVLLGRESEALGRAIIWRDQRATAEAAWLGEHISGEDAARWTGLNQLAQATLPPARLLWLKAHRADDWAATQVVLQPKDYLAFKLTGAVLTDINSAYALAHPSPPHYAADYLAALGIAPGSLPPLSPAHGVAGRVTPEAARATGLPAGLPVIIGTIDAFCDLLGSGAVEPGLAVDVAGTSEMIGLAVGAATAGEGVFAASLDGRLNFLCGPTQAGGDALRWLAQGFFPELNWATGHPALEQAAASCPPGSAGLLFLPYLDGERAPIWDPQARAAFIGLTLAHGRAHCARAVYEGVAFAARHVLERCETTSGQPARQVHVCGGGARSEFWNQLKADVFNRPVVAADIEAACLGAAALAAAGIGLQPTTAAAARKLAAARQTYRPRPEAATVYEQAFGLYRELYPALRPAYGRLAALTA